MVAGAVGIGSGFRRTGNPGRHRDAVNRAWRDAQLTTGTESGDYRVGLPTRANDRINRAGWQAFDTPDTPIFVDDGNQGRPLNAVVRIEGQYFVVKQSGKRRNG